MSIVKHGDPVWVPSAFRLARGVAYACFLIAGSITLFAPSNIIFGIFGRVPFFVYFWSILFMMGSLFSLIGTVKRKWVGEYIGLPGIIACSLLYALGCFLDTPALTVQRVFLGFVFLGFTALALSRKKDVNFQRSIANYEHRVEEGKPGV